MTEQEAIKELNFLKHDLLSIDADSTVLDKYYEATIMAIQALEKQIPKKVIFVHPLQEDDVGDYMCPTCKRGTVYNAYGDKSLHCPYCDQALGGE